MNEKQLEELSFIKEWCITILDFMVSKYGNALIAEEAKNVVENGFSMQNLRGMRIVYRDTNDWAKGLRLSEVEELNILLQSKFGKDLNTQQGKNKSKIKKILKRGTIANNDEFRFVISYMDEIYSDSSKSKEIESLNKLMADYEKPPLG